jgi:hypothetical protein
MVKNKEINSENSKSKIFKKMGSKKTLKRVKQSIKLDPVDPSDFLNYNFTHSCEFCSHWNNGDGLCTLGYKNDDHRLSANLKTYELSGKMALCRFLEID